MSAQTIADKFRRALRNETGATFTLEQMREMAAYGVLQRIVDAECQELLSGFEVKSCTPAPLGSEEAPERARAALAREAAKATTGGARKRGPVDINVLSKGL